MADKKDRLSIPPIGASSLLTAFAVLCLVVFALLALTTVRADVALSDASLQATRDYYAADCQAQEILARLRNGERPEGVTFSGSGLLYADYAVPISDTQALQVTVILKGIADKEYSVLRWQTVSTTEWNGDDALHVWDGGASK